MATIPTVSDGDTTSAPDQYNILANAFINVLGITESTQAWIKVTELQLADANTKLAKDGSGNLALTDAVTGTKTLSELVATGTDWFLGYPCGGYPDTLTGNVIYLIPIRPSKGASVTSVIIEVYTPSGSFLGGIYDNDGNRLVVVPVQQAAAGEMTFTFGSALSVVAGETYWLALICSVSNCTIRLLLDYPAFHKEVSQGSFELPDEITIPTSGGTAGKCPSIVAAIAGGLF